MIRRSKREPYLDTDKEYPATNVLNILFYIYTTLTATRIKRLILEYLHIRRHTYEQLVHGCKFLTMGIIIIKSR
jgi:hypothetical protein